MTRSSFPDDRRPTLGEQLMDTMFAPLPSGPQTPIPPREAGRRAAYQAWKRSEAGGRMFGWMLARAREQLLDGKKRIGVKGLCEKAREEFQSDFNNTWTCWVSDDLVAADARLLPLIERRVRRASA